MVTFNCITNPKPAPDPCPEAAHRAGMRVVQLPDMLATSGPYAHHLADDLLSGARMAGLI